MNSCIIHKLAVGWGLWVIEHFGLVIVVRI